MNERREYTHRSVTFFVGPRSSDYPGIVWSIPCWDHLSRPIAPLESSGCFYDDCPDHPEGAYAWAESSARKFIGDEEVCDGDK